MSTDNKPLRGPKYRSRAFQEYLDSQPPERQAQIVAGEKAFTALQADPGSLRVAAERDYAEDMTTPAEWQTDLTDR